VHGLIVAQTMPSPLKVSMPLMRELIQAVAVTGHKVNLDYTTVEGYVVAKAAVEILRKSSRLDREGFRKTLVSTSREMDLGGLVLDFSGGKRDGGDYVELSVIGPDGKVRN
jgi:branched-chain amino acid transport system substrate-binding protein